MPDEHSLKVKHDKFDPTKTADNIDPYKIVMKEIVKEEIDVSDDKYDYQMDHIVKYEVDVFGDEYDYQMDDIKHEVDDYQMDIKLEDGYICTFSFYTSPHERWERNQQALTDILAALPTVSSLSSMMIMMKVNSSGSYILEPVQLSSSKHGLSAIAEERK